MCLQLKIYLSIFLCFFVKTSFASDSIKLTCKFGLFTFAYENDSITQYECNLQDDFPYIKETAVDSIAGNHITGKNRNDVVGLTIISKDIFIIPNLFGLLGGSNGLKYIYIKNTPLRDLKNEHFIDYKTKLKHLVITNSEIEIIDEGLFNGFLIIETIDLQNNKIFYIDSIVFTSLPLKNLMLKANLCNDPNLLETDAAYIGNFKSIATGTLADILTKIDASLCTAPILAEIISKYKESKVAFDQEKYESDKALEEILGIKEECENNVTSLEESLSTANNEYGKLKLQYDKLESGAEKCLDVEGTCRFTTNTNVYSCITHNIKITSSGTSIVWTGTHIAGLVDKNVIALIVRDLDVQYMPNNIGDTFKKLQTLIVQNCGLKKLSNKDFLNLYFLKTIQITSNDISSIDSGIFEDNLALESLDLSENKIKTLPSNLFTDLSSLITVKLDKNLLTSIKADFLPATIKYFSATYNKLTNIDSSFVWKLRGATLIDFMGNGCNQTFNGGNYIAFYTLILTKC